MSSNYPLCLKECSLFSMLTTDWPFYSTLSIHSILSGREVHAVRMNYNCIQFIVHSGLWIFKLYFKLHFYLCVHMYVQGKPEINIWYLPLSFSTLSFERSLIEPGVCQFGQTGWHQAQISSHCVSSNGITDVHAAPSLLHGYWCCVT